MIKATLTAPVIKCSYEMGRFVFLCEYCNKKHFHGYGEGHRIAHCDLGGNSPYLDTGYYLVEDKKVVM